MERNLNHFMPLRMKRIVLSIGSLSFMLESSWQLSLTIIAGFVVLAMIYAFC